MDVSTSCYLLVIPGLLVAFRYFLPFQFVNRFIWIYTILLLSIASFLAVLDLGLYPHWGTRVNITAFNYINDPVAMSASVSIGDVLLGLLIGGSLILNFVFFYKRLFPEGVIRSGKIKW